MILAARARTALLAIAALALIAPTGGQAYPGQNGWRTQAPCPNVRRTHWEVSRAPDGRRVVKTWVQTPAGVRYSQSYQ